MRALARKLARACLALTFWSAIAVVFALPSLGTAAAPRLPTLLHSLAGWWSWGLLAPVVAAIVRRMPEPAGRPWLRVGAHLLLAPAMAVASLYLSTLLAASLGIDAFSQLADPALVANAIRTGLIWEIVVYGLIAGVCEAVLAQRRYLSAALRAERIERSYADARLAALRLQLDPHFLFNALNAVSAELAHRPRLAREMIEHLATLLRISLDGASRHTVRLADELALLDHYLAIQRVRFGDRLAVRLDVPAALADAIVPSLLLQPLVENAIRHGIAQLPGGGTVEVTARSAGARLAITVADDGVGPPPDWRDGACDGVGLSVTRERLAHLDPDGRADLALRRREPGGAELVLSLPLALADAAPDHG